MAIRIKVGRNKEEDRITTTTRELTNGRTTIKKLVVNLVAKREVKISKTTTLVVKTVGKL